jgi:hypothetical protein
MIRIILLIILIFLYGSHSVFAFPDDSVARSIITDIQWDEDVPQIEIHYIVLIKKKDRDIQVYRDYVKHIQSDNFKKKPWDRKEIIDYLKENYYEYVYQSDEIFGHRVEVYADLSKSTNLSEEEIEKYISQAKIEVERDFANPPSFEDKTGRYGVFKIIFYLALILLVIILVKVRYK